MSKDNQEVNILPIFTIKDGLAKSTTSLTIDTSPSMVSKDGKQDNDDSFNCHHLVSKSFDSLTKLPTPLIDSTDTFRNFLKGMDSKLPMLNSKMNIKPKRIISEYNYEKDIHHRVNESAVSNPVNRTNYQPTNSDTVKEAEDYIYEVESIDNQSHRYKFLSNIGKGAFSTVVLAESLDSKGKVAIKINKIPCASPHLNYYKDVLARELNILKQLNHPCITNILGYKDFHLNESTNLIENLIVLPYFPGGNLLEFTTSQKILLQQNPVLVERIFGELATSVSYLHRNNFIHRDIKLENVLMNFNSDYISNLTQVITDWKSFNQPLTKLTDFGLSKKIDPSNPLLTTRCGSDDYVAPEILIGIPYDGRETDIWSLGVILFSLLEFRLPFDNFTPKVKVKTDGKSHLIIRKKSSKKRSISHKIVMIDWCWDIMNDNDAFKGAVNIVENCLVKKDTRIKFNELYLTDYVSTALPDSFKNV